MSCFVMKPESIRQIGYTIEKIFNCYLYSNTATITMHAVDAAGGLPACLGGYYIQPGSLGVVFADCRTPSGDFDGEMIARELWRLNVAAYNGRYNEQGGEELPPDLVGLPDIRRAYSLWKMPEYADHMEKPQEWHYHLCRLLDCWLYQTCEDATDKHEKRQALRKFSDALKVAIVQHSDDYNNFRWGC